MPILLYKPKFGKLRGRVSISKDIPIRFGMIQIGKNIVSLYPNSGCKIEILSGDIIFKGSCTIGNNSSISVSNNGILTFGPRFKATAQFRIACYKTITFGKDVLFGWDCICFDNDFHSTTDVNTGLNSSLYSPIIIGDFCWLSYGITILKGTVLPQKTVVAAKSLTNCEYDIPPCSMIAGMPAKIKKTGVWRNPENDI